MMKILLYLYMSDHLIHKHVIHSLHMLMSMDFEHFFTVMTKLTFCCKSIQSQISIQHSFKSESNKIRITKRVLVSFIFISCKRLNYNIQCINTCYTIYSICIITVFLSFTQKTIVFLCNF